MKKHILFAALIAVALSLAVIVFAKNSTRQGGTPQPAPAGNAISLREKARRDRQHVVFANPNGVKRFKNVDMLVQDSTLIITGTIERQASRFSSPEERSIITDFQVRVENVLKGDAAHGEYLTVREPGGRMQFEDGSSAEVRMPDFWESPAVGKRYTLFLKQKGSVYLLFGGPQGLFEISHADTVIPQVSAEDTLTKQYNGKRSADFLEEVQQATKHP
jgi:hypothetical protein